MTCNGPQCEEEITGEVFYAFDNPNNWGRFCSEGCKEEAEAVMIEGFVEEMESR